MTMPRSLLLVVLAWTFLLRPSSAETPGVARWGRWEQTFTAPRGTSPDLEFTVDLESPSGKKHSISGFWDGGESWRVRFRPDETGKWRYKTTSRPAVVGVSGQKGAFECIANEGNTRFARHGVIKVAKEGTYLAHADGTPFFWMGDTVWNGPLLSQPEEWQTFLKDRQEKKFSVIQFNALAPWRTAPTDAEGQVAFTGRRNITINPRFFQRLDQRMDAINAAGMVAAPVLVWSLTGEDPGQYLSEEDILKLVRYQVARYGAYHVVWILAGDNPYKGDLEKRWKKIGQAVFGSQPHAPVTTHPTGMNWPWERWRNEKWLDILGYQSGHGDDAGTLAWIHSGPAKQHWRQAPLRPIINLEPPYEDHRAYQSKKPHSAYNVRRAVYWSLLSTPPAGVTYGAHGIWSWQTKAGEEPRAHKGTGVAKVWREAMQLPGSSQMKHVVGLFESLSWWTLRPADELLATQPGARDPARFVAAARSESKKFAVVYFPKGAGKVTLKEGGLAQGVTGRWFDPRRGDFRTGKIEATETFLPPDGDDWVLVLQTWK